MLEERSPTRGPILLAVVCLSCLVGAVFFRVLRFELIALDTPGQVINNPHVQGLSGENLKRILLTWGNGGDTTSFYPVRTLTYAIDCQLWGGLKPRGLKLTNVLIHLANVLLVFWLVLRFLGHTVGASTSQSARWDVFVGALSAGIFAVHPVVVEPVTWVPGREELLMTLGALGCMHLHVTARRLGERGGQTAKAAACHAGAALACGLACLSNAVAAVIPLLVTAWDALMLGRPKAKKILYGTSVLWAIGTATVVLKTLTDATDPTDPGLKVFSAQWLMVILNVYWLNLRTLVWPADLTIYYPRVAPESFLEAGVLLGALAVVLTGLAIWIVRRQRLALFGLLWFAFALGPTSQLMPHHLDRADRFLYLPLAGLVLMLAVLLRPAGSTLKKPWTVAAAAGAGILALLLPAAVSVNHTKVFRDSRSMWESSLRLHPSHGFAHACLADILAEQGLFEQASAHYESALRLDPGDTKTLNNYALRLATHRREELRDYARAIRLAGQGCEITGWEDAKLRRTLAVAYMNLATARKREGRLDEAVRHYANAVGADPSYEAPLFHFALLLATSRDERLRQPDEAVWLAERAYARVERPGWVQLKILAEVYAGAGRFGQAAGAIEKAIPLALAEGEPGPAGKLRRQLQGYREKITPKTRG